MALIQPVLCYGNKRRFVKHIHGPRSSTRITRLQQNYWAHVIHYVITQYA